MYRGIHVGYWFDKLSNIGGLELLSKEIDIIRRVSSYYMIFYALLLYLHVWLFVDCIHKLGVEHV